MRLIVISDLRFAFGQQSFDQGVDYVPVLGVREHQAAVIAALKKQPADGRIVHLQIAFVRHEHFEARYALLDQPRNLVDILLVPLENRDMKSIVDDRFASRLLMPCFKRVGQWLAFPLVGKVNRRRPTAGRRYCPRIEIIAAVVPMKGFGSMVLTH